VDGWVGGWWRMGEWLRGRWLGGRQAVHALMAPTANSGLLACPLPEWPHLPTNLLKVKVVGGPPGQGISPLPAETRPQKCSTALSLNMLTEGRR